MTTMDAPAQVVEQERPVFRSGLVLDYGQAALANLSANRRVFDRLDWWLVEEWAASDAFIAIGHKRDLLGAMLAAPVLFDDINRLASARSDVAWLRWCAIRDGVSATPLVRGMIEACRAALQRVGVRRLMCIAESTHWLTPYLYDFGFRRVDDVVTLSLRRADWRAGRSAHRPASAARVRPAETSDISAVLDVDNRAFEIQWCMSADAFVRAWRVASVLQVAERAGQVAGYVLATSFGDEAHIARLAVSPDLQGRGIGSALLYSALGRLLDNGAVRSVTLNTQASNAASLALYHRFGFQLARPRMRVMCLDLKRAESQASDRVLPP
ncbi:MAG: GNAT family N-acetyltransferase [Candidatus Roseilinea sp.]|uniref:GNAT family N-acetyltransferase n=1 Tax=Candidatus Roseilinea sp. TaxID=2838777 RepID=UPI00404A7C2B